LWRDGRLLATYKDGHAHLNAYLDDHAFLIDALLELVQTEFRTEDLDFCRAIADRLLEQFEDAEQGGFYFLSHDHERLIHRPKSGYDNATPSGNGVAAFALQRLGHLLGQTRYLDAAERTLKLFYPQMTRGASGFPSLLSALNEALQPARIVITRGRREELARFDAHMRSTYRPDTVVVSIPHDADGLPAAMAKPAPENGFRAWICHGMTCLPPISDLQEIDRTLRGR
jgi:uncharacterized protein YyaL (SSP411 family)